LADSALKAAARFWFVVAVIAQLVFAFATASFYGLTVLRGDYHGWRISQGHVAGDLTGNSAVAMHLISAVVIMLAGAVQLVPQVRSRFPVFHRWNGLIYMLAALAVSAAGVYMTWRGSVGDLSQHIGGSLNAVFIWLFAGMALRYAVARDFRTHRRWALRLFLVVSAAWFFRIVVFLSFVVFKGPVGFDPTTFRGPFLTFMSFGQYLLPLAFLELYLRAQERPGAIQRMAAAAGLFIVTLAMGAGVFAVPVALWVPEVKAAFDSRKSIAETLSRTIASGGIGEAVRQYHDLKAAAPATYNFDEDQLNALGYRFIQAKEYRKAIRIFQLNAEAYPQSSNVYDSLGEAYMDDGNKAQAIANYQKSLALNPKNGNAVVMLERLKAR
jgi:tetratricopeptide (TPR) repeat protein